MKRQISCFLIVLLLIGLTACGKVHGDNVTESGNSAMTTDLVDMVAVEVLTETVYYDAEGNVEYRWEIFYDEMGRHTRVVCTDSKGNIIEEDTTRWNDDKSSVDECFIYSQDNGNLEMYVEQIHDTEGAVYSAFVRYYGEEITEVEARARTPYGNESIFWYLDVEQYQAGDWGTSGWHYSTDQEGNKLCWIEVTTQDGVERTECKYRPNGDLLYCISKTDGVVTSKEEHSYDEKGRPVRWENWSQIGEWSYNDAANTGKYTSYVTDYPWNEYEGYRKKWFEEYVFDKNGNPLTVYGQEYDTHTQTLSDTYTGAWEYDENGICRSYRKIDGDSGEIVVYTYDAHGNQILRETYNADGILEETSRSDYIYTTIQVTAEAAEMYHTK